MTDRKYRQKGYQDSNRGASGPRPPQPPRERREGPRGRGLGAPRTTVFRCANCGHKRDDGPDVGLETVCVKCGADLHTCSNCQHFDTSQPKECRQPIPVRISSKTRRNTCELFTAKATVEFDPEGGSRSGGKAAFDALFKF